MKKSRVPSLVAAACLLFAACSANPTASTANDTAPGQDAEVTIADMTFTPGTVTIAPGSTVTWTNDDSVPHTVTFSDEGVPSSEIIEPGQTFRATFQEAGSYEYTCSLHPGMKGAVEVIDQEAAAGQVPDEPAAAQTGSTASSTTALETTDAGSQAEPADVALQLPGAGAPGVEVTLGEWALVASAEDAPPGSITFRFRNAGTVRHGFRIRTAGSGRDRLEWRAETIGPGETALLVADLAPGVYEIDCPVEDGHGEHDELGMEMIFTVRDGAAELPPLPATGAIPSSPSEAADAKVTIASFAFSPSDLVVPAGTTVTWSNGDPTPHTVTSDVFDTGVLEPEASAKLTFEAAGTFEYFCAIHPAMQGRVVVES